MDNLGSLDAPYMVAETLTILYLDEGIVKKKMKLSMYSQTEQRKASNRHHFPG
jgi:hypothetical protein